MSPANDIEATPIEHVTGGWERGCRCLACSTGRRDIEHGGTWAYQRGCRCGPCKAGNAARHREFAAGYAARVAANPRKYKHGTTLYTNAGCRCRTCVRAKKAENAKRLHTHPGPRVSDFPIGIGEVYAARRGTGLVEVVAVTPHPRVKNGREIQFVPDGRSGPVASWPTYRFTQAWRPATAADCSRAEAALAA